MKKQIETLTEQESAFAAEHHSLIFRYLSQKRLPKDEYYDVVVFGYLNGVKKYFRQEELRALQFQLEEMKAKISAPASDMELLRKKCETIENFRNSFPYRIAEGYILYNIMRTEIQVSGYSRWQLVGECDNQLWAYTLLRPDTQSYKEMLSLAAATSSPQELSELNISEQLLWN